MRNRVIDPADPKSMRLTRRECLFGTFATAVLLGTGTGVAQSERQTAIVAETAYGRVRGRSTRGVQVFKGVPYGGPAEGARRFLPPSAVTPWSGVREATATGPRAIQGPGVLFLNPLIGEYFSGGRSDRQEIAAQSESENCLNLNVLTPALNGRRPVLVYIHGGGFASGSNVLTAFADRFVREHDVVLVGINHRLNMFGYLYLGGFNEKFADSGNVGQLDLVAALHWVQKNITNFGGDPANVTIFGESGGGAKISALLSMPAAKGLFRRAIIESGSGLRAVTRDAADRAARAALDRIGVTPARVEELQTMPLERLRTAGGGTGAVVDGRSIPEQTWDPAAPAAAAGIPMIIGNCKDESTLFSRTTPELFALDEPGLRERLAKEGVPADAVGRLVEWYKRDYPGETPSDIWFRISTDRGARLNAITQAERKLAQGDPVYMYYFAWNTPIADGNIRIKAFHTAELPLAMRLVRYAESETLSRQIAGAWAAFARSGNPSHGELPAWPRYDLHRRATMIFDTPSRVADNPNRDQQALLRQFASGRLL